MSGGAAPNSTEQDWDWTGIQQSWSEHKWNTYKLMCITLYTRMMAKQYHPRTNRTAREDARALYEKLTAILWTPAPDEGTEVLVRYVHTPAVVENGHTLSTAKYTQVVEEREHQDAILGKDGNVELVTNPRKVRTGEEHDLLQTTVKTMETQHLGLIQKHLKKHAPNLLLQSAVK